MRIAFKSQYLVEYFKGQEGIVSMGVSSPSAPALFTTAGMPDVVMMPMSVQWDEGPAQEKTTVEGAPVPTQAGEEAQSEKEAQLTGEGAEASAALEPEYLPKPRGRRGMKRSQ